MSFDTVFFYILNFTISFTRSTLTKVIMPNSQPIDDKAVKEISAETGERITANKRIMVARQIKMLNFCFKKLNDKIELFSKTLIACEVKPRNNTTNIAQSLTLLIPTVNSAKTVMINAEIATLVKRALSNSLLVFFCLSAFNDLSKNIAISGTAIKIIPATIKAGAESG